MRHCRLQFLLPVLLLALSACSDLQSTHPVKGKVVFDQGDVKLLAGSSVYCCQVKDGSVAARGDIQEDGSFTLETHHKGQVLPGALPGTYRATIVLDTSDESEERQRRTIGIDPRYLDGQATPLTFKVPAEGDVVLTVTRPKPGNRPPVATDPDSRPCED